MNKLTIIGHLTGAEIEVKTFDQNYILSNSEDFKKPVVSGVYVLMYRGNIIYVGSSMNVYKRIKSHKQKPRTMVFDSYFSDSTICNTRDALLAHERAYIIKFKPKHNKDYVEDRSIKRIQLKTF